MTTATTDELASKESIIKYQERQDREYCRDCVHFSERSTCDFPTPAWAKSISTVSVRNVVSLFNATSIVAAHDF